MRSKGRRVSRVGAVVAVLCAVSSFARAQTDGLLIYLSLDDGDGDIATSGPEGELDIDGILENNPLWIEVPDEVPGCGALEFDGVSNSVRIEPDDPLFDDPFSPQVPFNEGQITICAWVKVLEVATDAHTQSRQPIVMKGAGGEWEYALYVTDSLSAQMSVWQCGGNGVAEPGGGFLIQDEWHHVCGTFDIELGASVYIDALEVAQAPPDPGEEPCDGTRPVFIGHREDGQFLNAAISEVAIWNRVLELDEIEDNMGGELATAKEECEMLTCPAEGDADFADTHCTGIEIEGPDEGNVTGSYTVKVGASDDSGDNILYRIEVYEKGVPDNTVRAQRTGDGEFRFRLDEGTWTITVTVDDSSCPDEAGDSTCTVDVDVAAREGGLILYLPFDDEDDPTANEVGEDGILVNLPEWVDGQEGDAALEFDGFSQYVEVPEDLSPQAPGNEGELSICAWVSVIMVATDAHGQTRQPIVMKGAGGEWEYALYVYDDFGAGMSVWNCDGMGVSEPHAAGTLIPEEWHHVCGTFHADDGVTVYVDGQEVVQQPPNANEPCDGTQPVLIASRSDGQFLNATIDEVAMWNRALTAGEVLDVMEEGVLPETPGPAEEGFTRGDCNADDDVNLTDAVCTLDFLFGGAVAPGCLAALDVNGGRRQQPDRRGGGARVSVLGRRGPDGAVSRVRTRDAADGRKPGVCRAALSVARISPGKGTQERRSRFGSTAPGRGFMES